MNLDFNVGFYTEEIGFDSKRLDFTLKKQNLIGFYSEETGFDSKKLDLTLRSLDLIQTAWILL